MFYQCYFWLVQGRKLAILSMLCEVLDVLKNNNLKTDAAFLDCSSDYCLQEVSEYNFIFLPLKAAF